MVRTIARGLRYGGEVPPKNLLKIYGLMFVIALIAVVIITIAVLASGASSATTGTTGTTGTTIDRDSLVRIQVRAPQRAPVMMNGRAKGTTPLMLLVPRSATPVMISVSLGGRTLTKQVTPGDDSVLDFP